MALASKISLTTFLAILISLVTIAVAAKVYTGNQYPYTYDASEEPNVPLSSWAGDVAGAAASRGEGTVEGTPSAYGTREMPETNGTVIMPKPGIWEIEENDTEICHTDVLELISKASYVSAKGIVYEQLVYMHSEPHRMLVATELEIHINETVLHLEYEGPGRCMPPHPGGGMGGGMGEMDDEDRWGSHHDREP